LQFETKGIEFDDHTTSAHNVWNYIFFLYSIKKKDVTEYNGLESYVREMVEREDIGWIPLMKAIDIKQNDKEQKNSLDESLKQLWNRVKAIMDRFKILENDA
jgi:hypothetical protein